MAQIAEVLQPTECIDLHELIRICNENDEEASTHKSSLPTPK